MERHKAATATAGKALRVAGKGAAEFGKGVVSGVKTVGKVARDVRRVVGESEEMELDEKIDVGADVSSTISDFVHSNSKTFKGDSKNNRIERALGAYYAAKKANVDEANMPGEEAPTPTSTPEPATNKNKNQQQSFIIPRENSIHLNLRLIFALHKLILYLLLFSINCF